MKLLIRVVVLIFIFIAAINYLDYNRIIEKETEGSIVTEKKIAVDDEYHSIWIKDEDTGSKIQLQVKEKEIWDLIMTGEKYDVVYRWYGNEKPYLKSISYSKK
ncbi:hypothetical protein [Bacillus sp. P14.5]|uniref:hypothetical protein n=1 Tax=Bacillus sp. P14.5 TaxID=1983400 RepID=UPI000DE97282|nr:hypothetical protein [Bacillus sp. P14.5]